MIKYIITILIISTLAIPTIAQIDTTSIQSDLMLFPQSDTASEDPIKKDRFKFLAKSTFTLLTDQDLFAINRNEDRNYTMGVGILFSSSKTNEAKILINKNYLILPWIRKKLDLDSLFTKGLKSESSLKNYSFEIRASGFTPIDIGNKEVVFGDRPYGMVLSFGSTRQNTVNPSGIQKIKQRSYTTSFYVGFLGTRIGENVQTYIHKNNWAGSTRPIPLGWPNQISDKKYLPPIFLYTLNYQKPLTIYKTNPSAKFPIFQLWSKLETNIGYFTNVSGGIGLRLGKIIDGYYQGQNVTSNVHAQGAEDNYRFKNWQIYFFSNSRIRLVGYNTLLQGRMFFDNSIYTLKSNQISRFIFELDYGLAANYKGIKLAFIPFSMRSTEILTNFRRTHYYGTLFLSISKL
jgi:hypothetical protein